MSFMTAPVQNRTQSGGSLSTIACAQQEASEVSYADLYNFAPVSCFTLRPEGEITQTNLAGARLLGCDRGELLGQRFSDFVTEADRLTFSTCIQQVFAGQPQQTCEVALRTRGKPLTIAQVEIALGPGGHTCHAVLVDITENKRAKEELRLAREAAEMVNRAKSSFLANMSHELRTPMNAILGFSQLMLRDPELAVHQREQVQTIARSGEHLMEIINDILEMARLEAGRVTLDSAPFDLHLMLNDLTHTFSLRAQAKDLRFRAERMAAVPRHIVADEAKLRQVIVHLLGNAIKFTPAGGSIVLRVQSVEEPDGMIRLRAEVEDTGPGIASEDLPHLFETFYQAAARRQVAGGIGLGLPISRQFVRLMGGDLTVSSRPGVGSTFRFDARVARGEEPAAQSSTTRARRVLHLLPESPACRVLVTDDQMANRKLLLRRLAPIGFEVRAANDGAEAVALCKEWSPHLVLLDLRMPVMDGYEATRCIRAAHGSTVKIIALSASVFADDQQQALDCGADAFMAKPYREEDLLGQISQLTGVDYVWDDSMTRADEPLASARPDVPSAEEILRLPAELVASLRQATSTADYDRMLALTDQAANQDEALGRRLRHLVEQFNYNALLSVLSAGRDRA